MPHSDKSWKRALDAHLFCFRRLARYHHSDRKRMSVPGPWICIRSISKYGFWHARCCHHIYDESTSLFTVLLAYMDTFIRASLIVKENMSTVLLEYLAKMNQLQHTGPGICQSFIEWNCWVKRGSIPFTSLGDGHTLEQKKRVESYGLNQSQDCRTASCLGRILSIQTWWRWSCEHNNIVTKHSLHLWGNETWVQLTFGNECAWICFTNGAHQARKSRRRLGAMYSNLRRAIYSLQEKISR